MIKIIIGTNGQKVFDSFEKKNTTLNEVSLVLLRLKQIEKELINIDFKSEYEEEGGK